MLLGGTESWAAESWAFPQGSDSDVEITSDFSISRCSPKPGAGKSDLGIEYLAYILYYCIYLRPLITSSFFSENSHGNL